jgi:hypothetical protein
VWVSGNNRGQRGSGKPSALLQAVGSKRFE